MIEARDVEPGGDELRAERIVPEHALRADAHDQQQRPPGVAEHVVGELDLAELRAARAHRQLPEPLPPPPPFRPGMTFFGAHGSSVQSSSGSGTFGGFTALPASGTGFVFEPAPGS